MMVILSDYVHRKSEQPAFISWPSVDCCSQRWLTQSIRLQSANYSDRTMAGNSKTTSIPRFPNTHRAFCIRERFDFQIPSTCDVGRRRRTASKFVAHRPENMSAASLWTCVRPHTCPHPWGRGRRKDLRNFICRNDPSSGSYQSGEGGCAPASPQ
jgi:hypothetical protein